MNAYWEDHPPVHLMVAALLGIKPQKRQADSDDDIFATLTQFPGAVHKQDMKHG
jgi:hypothetical protein